jgi:hypothetical protein
MTNQVIINCPNPTVAALVDEGSALVAFSAVQAGDRSGVPLVWMCTKSFSNITTLQWSTSYGAYACLSMPTSGSTVSPKTAAPIKLGQRFEVADGPAGTVKNGGVPGAITIHNETEKEYAWGIARPGPGGTPAPVCAFPLYGESIQTVVPLAEIVLLFTTVPLAVGAPLPPELTVSVLSLVATGITGPALLLDMTKQTAVAVRYDINTGWSWASGVSGAKVIEPSQILAALIQ